MNLNTPLNQHVTYSYNTPSPAPSTTSRRDSFPPPHPLGQNGFDPTGQVKSEYNYYQLSSDEKFEILKSISASFTPGYGGFLPNTPPLGHHYLSPSGLPGKAEYQERPLYPPQGQMYEQSSSDGKDDGQHYQSLDGYGHKAQNAGFAESSTSSVSQGGSQSLAHKLVLAKINGKSKRGRPSKRQEREDEAPVEYRVVKTEPNQTNHPPSETEDSDDPLGESMVVEPEYTPVTQIGGTAGLEFNRSQFEKTFQNYSMTTTGHRGGKGPPVKKFPCDQCGKSFTLKQNLTYHVNSIHLGVRIKCDFCDKTFAHKPNLIAHMNSAHNGVRFKCDHCVKSFNQKPNLISHIKSVHEGIKYKCEECTKTFAQKQNLLSHVQAIHMGIKYTCEVCSKSYNQVTNLLSHMTTVHQAQKYKCADCGRLFAQEHTLRTHTLSVHSGVRLTCRTCGLFCDSKRALTAHVREAHPGCEYKKRGRGRPKLEVPGGGRMVGNVVGGSGVGGGQRMVENQRMLGNGGGDQVRGNGDDIRGDGDQGEEEEESEMEEEEEEGGFE